jgi:hypothetical protein
MLRGQAAAKAMPLRAGDAAQIRLEEPDGEKSDCAKPLGM